MKQLLGPATRVEFTDESRLNFAALIGIFGDALTRRLTEQSNPHNTFGKHFHNAHHHKGRRNPAGSKLCRRIIRTSERESTYWRNRYAKLTGRQYNHLNTPDAPTVLAPTGAADVGETLGHTKETAT